MSNKDMILFIMIIMVVTWIAILGTLAYIIIVCNTKIAKLKKESAKNEVDIEKIKILLGENVVDKIDQVLDAYITNASNIYQILEIATSQKEFLNNEDIEKMISYISAMVMKNMTEESIALLKLTHVIKDQKDLSDLISLRTKLYVLNFSIEFNVMKE